MPIKDLIPEVRLPETTSEKYRGYSLLLIFHFLLPFPFVLNHHGYHSLHFYIPNWIGIFIDVLNLCDIKSTYKKKKKEWDIAVENIYKSKYYNLVTNYFNPSEKHMYIHSYLHKKYGGVQVFEQREPLEMHQIYSTSEGWAFKVVKIIRPREDYMFECTIKEVTNMEILAYANEERNSN